MALVFWKFRLIKPTSPWFPLINPYRLQRGVQSQLTTTKLATPKLPEAIEYNFTIPASDLFTRSPGDWHLDQAVSQVLGFFGVIFWLKVAFGCFFWDILMWKWPNYISKKKHASLFWVLSRGSVEMAWRSVLIGVVFFSRQSCPGVGWGEMEVVGVSNMWYQELSGSLKQPKYRWQIKNLYEFMTSQHLMLFILRSDQNSDFFLASLSSWKNFFKLSHLRRGAIFIFAWKSLKNYKATYIYIYTHHSNVSDFNAICFPFEFPNFWGCPKHPTEVCVPLFLVLMISLKKCGQVPSLKVTS